MTGYERGGAESWVPIRWWCWALFLALASISFLLSLYDSRRYYSMQAWCATLPRLPPHGLMGRWTSAHQASAHGVPLAESLHRVAGVCWRDTLLRLISSTLLAPICRFRSPILVYSVENSLRMTKILKVEFRGLQFWSRFESGFLISGLGPPRLVSEVPDLIAILSSMFLTFGCFFS
jgi:hypothetical protein